MKDAAVIVKTAYNAMTDKKAQDISIIDISGVSVIADYFVICSGDNTLQVQAIQSNVDEMLSKTGFDVKRVEGNRSSNWVLMDYGDVVVHIFSKEDRLFYDLERIWRDGKNVSIDEL